MDFHAKGLRMHYILHIAYFRVWIPYLSPLAKSGLWLWGYEVLPRFGVSVTL
jgi:hypothetical protein